jgi:4a-hydroxytetrahydrobiopterin dehydratase
MSLKDRHCVPCKEGSPALSREQATDLFKELPGWELDAAGKEISRLFSFDSYWAGLGFVNAVAWIAQAEKHHPDLALFYKKVKVSFTTHSVGGLSENDFICAAKVNALLP